MRKFSAVTPLLGAVLALAVPALVSAQTISEQWLIDATGEGGNAWLTSTGTNAGRGLAYVPAGVPGNVYTSATLVVATSTGGAVALLNAEDGSFLATAAYGTTGNGTVGTYQYAAFADGAIATNGFAGEVRIVDDVSGTNPGNITVIDGPGGTFPATGSGRTLTARGNYRAGTGELYVGRGLNVVVLTQASDAPSTRTFQVEEIVNTANAGLADANGLRGIAVSPDGTTMFVCDGSGSSPIKRYERINNAWAFVRNVTQFSGFVKAGGLATNGEVIAMAEGGGAQDGWGIAKLGGMLDANIPAGALDGDGDGIYDAAASVFDTANLVPAVTIDPVSGDVFGYSGAKTAAPAAPGGVFRISYSLPADPVTTNSVTLDGVYVTSISDALDRLNRNDGAPDTITFTGPSRDSNAAGKEVIFNAQTSNNTRPGQNDSLTIVGNNNIAWFDDTNTISAGTSLINIEIDPNQSIILNNLTLASVPAFGQPSGGYGITIDEADGQGINGAVFTLDGVKILPAYQAPTVGNGNAVHTNVAVDAPANAVSVQSGLCYNSTPAGSDTAVYNVDGVTISLFADAASFNPGGIEVYTDGPTLNIIDSQIVKCQDNDTSAALRGGDGIFVNGVNFNTQINITNTTISNNPGYGIINGGTGSVNSGGGSNNTTINLNAGTEISNNGQYTSGRGASFSASSTNRLVVNVNGTAADPVVISGNGSHGLWVGGTETELKTVSHLTAIGNVGAGININGQDAVNAATTISNAKLIKNGSNFAFANIYVADANTAAATVAITSSTLHNANPAGAGAAIQLDSASADALVFNVTNSVLTGSSEDVAIKVIAGADNNTFNVSNSAVVLLAGSDPDAVAFGADVDNAGTGNTFNFTNWVSAPPHYENEAANDLDVRNTLYAGAAAGGADLGGAFNYIGGLTDTKVNEWIFLAE